MPTKLKLDGAFRGLWKPALIHFSAFSNSLFFFLSTEIPCQLKILFHFPSGAQIVCDIWSYSSLLSKVGNPESGLFQRQQIQLSLCRGWIAAEYITPART